MYENNNQVTIEGEITTKFTYSHEMYGEKFFTFELKSPRFSDENDYIKVTVSERTFNVKQNCTGKSVRVQGQLRSYNKWKDNKSRLMVTAFAKKVEFIDCAVPGKDTNMVVLEGYVCTPPVHRITPLGRDIADWILGVDRNYRKNDYIPCISWGRNAHFVSKLPVGSLIRITGRIQSREYVKKISETENEVRIAYEVSVITIEPVKESTAAIKETENGEEQ